MNLFSFFEVLVFLIIIKYINCTKIRQKKSLLFPSSSTMGIFAAIAVPIDLPHRNVFVSYNFEANYNLPTLYSDLFPGPLAKLENLAEDGERSLVAGTISGNNSNTQEYDFKKETNYPEKRSLSEPLITRKSIYKMLEQKLESFGFPGKVCLLKAICEVNESNLGENNGVLGSILHIIFSPSTSAFENILDEYYEAEIDGENFKCEKYNIKCPNDMLDLISVYRYINI